MRRLAPILLFLSLLTVYGMTLAPGLTWANRGADGGDLITAAATGGVPHPTGYPVYLLLARLFQLLPIGSLAFRSNLLSALAAAFASLWVYGLTMRVSDNYWAGLVAAYAFGLAPLPWSQAVITEVYALHAFFVALILFLSINPPCADAKKSDLAIGLTFGLALGNHATTILLLPLILASVLTRRGSRLKLDLRALFHRTLWMGAGLSLYLLLPLRAAAHPPVNWGNPVTLENFGWLVTGRLYQDELLALTLSSLWEQIQSTAALLIGQFGIVGLTVSLLGLILFFRPSRLYASLLWTALAFSAFAIGFATQDSYVHLIPAILCFAIWLGLGVDGIMRLISSHTKKLAWTAGLAALVYLAALAAFHWPQVDASRDTRAEQFGGLVMAQMPADTLVFAKGDEAVFSLWYFHFALRQRPDLVIVASDLLPFDWYRGTLQATYPSLILQDALFPKALIASNSQRPACTVEYDDRVVIQCP